MERLGRLGTGIGWRPETADAVEGLPGIDWVEAVAENLCPGHLPGSILRLRARGTTVIPHGVSLGLGGADRPDAARLADLAATAEALGAPLVTEHIAFVRAGGLLTASPRLEAGHLLPVPRTWDALDVLCENVRIAQDSLPVPLALENIAALINWPDEDMTEGQFLAELVDRTGVRLLIDVANLHTNHVNRGEDPSAALDELPVEAIAYVHVAGGVEKDGVWHDTHAHPVTRPILDILADLRSRTDPPGVLLERDDNFPSTEALAAELTQIREALTPPAPPVGEHAKARPLAGPKAPSTSLRDAANATAGPKARAATLRGEADVTAQPEANTTPLRGEARLTAGPKAPAAPLHGEARATAGPKAPAASLRGGAGAATGPDTPPTSPRDAANATARPKAPATSLHDAASRGGGLRTSTPTSLHSQARPTAGPKAPAAPLHDEAGAATGPDTPPTSPRDAANATARPKAPATSLHDAASRGGGLRTSTPTSLHSQARPTAGPKAPAAPLHDEARAAARPKAPAASLRGGAGVVAQAEANATPLRGDACGGRGLGGSPQFGEGAGWGNGSLTEAPPRRDPELTGARTRLALAQASLLSALVAGTPVPAGFDSARLRVQSRALAGKRADVVAKVAPELPDILGAAYRAAFLAYAKSRPMAAGYRRDALDFAEHLLATGRPGDEAARKQLTHWWQDRAAPRPPSRTTRFVRAARAALVRK
ncbi:DUF692 family multinuclear iron-containing protein [Streptomyces sp. NPDC002994]|uniref:DUF692 domain-containing protein n=1 Tax=Streptomyces sp. NPDC002994 TaxID=3154441 RepID=UPI0033BDAA65